MKYKLHEFLTVLLFCGFLGAVLLGYALLPKQDFSETEKRYLTRLPAVTWDSVSTGEWGEDAEKYMADHIPLRSFFVGLNAYFELYTGRQTAGDVWLLGDHLAEAPVAWSDAVMKRNMTPINAFAEKLEMPLDLMLIPSAGWAMGDARYEDEAIIEKFYGAAGENVRPLDLSEVYAGQPDLYFKTDHHWNSNGAHAGYMAYMNALGRDYRAAHAFTVTDRGPFQGSTYSRSALWMTPGEALTVWQGSDKLTVTNAETDTTHDGVFYWERLEEADKYTLFLDGNHSLVRIQNPDKQGKLLVIRDSYSNLLGCFLAESYGEVVLVDLRYYRQSISELCEAEQFDNVLVAYSLRNFMTDTNLIWLK